MEKNVFTESMIPKGPIITQKTANVDIDGG